MDYPAPIDAQVATDWPVVDEYREAYAEVHRLKRAADLACEAAARLLGAKHRPGRAAEEAFARYTELMARLPRAERTAWELHARALLYGPEVHGALANARRTVEELAAHRAAACEADRDAALRAFLGR